MTVLNKSQEIVLASLAQLAVVRRQGGADTFGPRSRELFERLEAVFRGAGVDLEPLLDGILASQEVEPPSLSAAQIGELVQAIQASGIATNL